MAVYRDPQKNHLLAALPYEQWLRWSQHVERVEMPLGQVLQESGGAQSAGVGYRLNAQILKDEFNKAGPVLHQLLRYTQGLVTQMVQTVVGNRHHTLDQQQCRWLLLSLDRPQGDELVMTQEKLPDALAI